MKRYALLSQGSVRTLVRRGDIFSYMSKKFLPLFISAKIIKIDRDFPKLWSQMYCHLFYGSQCNYVHMLACCTCNTTNISALH